MSLWELEAILHGYNKRQPKPDGPPPLDLEDDELPDAEEWAQASAATARVVRSAQREDKA